MAKHRIMVFASGTSTGGGSGFRNLVEASRVGPLANAEVVGVMSQHAYGGGVMAAALELGVPFFYWYPFFAAREYSDRMWFAQAEWAVLSGFTKRVSGLDPMKTINVHPAPLPTFGGQGRWGLAAHRTVLAAFERGEITRTEVCVHFVTEQYDDGPVIFRCPIALRKGETPQQLQRRVKAVEHAWLPYVTDLVLRGKIRWDGSNPLSLRVPKWYNWL